MALGRVWLSPDTVTTVLGNAINNPGNAHDENIATTAVLDDTANNIASIISQTEVDFSSAPILNQSTKGIVRLSWAWSVTAGNPGTADALIRVRYNVGAGFVTLIEESSGLIINGNSDSDSGVMADYKFAVPAGVTNIIWEFHVDLDSNAAGGVTSADITVAECWIQHPDDATLGYQHV